MAPSSRTKCSFTPHMKGSAKGWPSLRSTTFPTLNDGIAGDPNDYTQAIASLGGTVPCTSTVVACVNANSNVINPTILNLYNLCNSNGHCSGFNNVWPTTSAIGGPASNNLDSVIGKIDYNLNTNNQISGCYFFGNSNQSFPLGVGGGDRGGEYKHRCANSDAVGVLKLGENGFGGGSERIAIRMEPLSQRILP